MKPTSQMNMTELKAFHDTHLGSSKAFIWQCPHCGKRYMELKEQKNDRLLNVQRSNA